VLLFFQVYVLSGEIMNSTLEIVEVLDLDTNTVGTLTGPGYYEFEYLAVELLINLKLINQRAHIFA
jgi:hypothetical protein